ncbi:hypothetical protein EUGRSUZ_B01762 [Eucalyptus grandis]|uniref:Uncharacterized protein n=2 Tax=Eucalyptus grandis TaxID=71139 RepID=A0ACC3LSI6_EUCGR|nr:hypothetical protein EUGRSUZ_B01762 [Eucalyptus grandis]
MLVVSGSSSSSQSAQRERERERERMGREVSESCVDSLLTEMVSSYCNRFYADKPDLAARRIEAIGYQVGHQLSERYTMERPRFSDHLEAIKFICKDFWSEVFKKQIDNLKTNHRVWELFGSLTCTLSRGCCCLLNINGFIMFVL